jgi:hypothetical protein
MLVGWLKLGLLYNSSGITAKKAQWQCKILIITSAHLGAITDLNTCNIFLHK